MPRNSSIEDQIRALTDSFTEELTALVRQAALESVQEAIAGVSEAPRRGPRPASRKKATRKKATRKKAGRKGGRRARRSSEDIEASGEAFLAYVKANPGQRLEEIGAALGEDTADLKRPVQVLLADRKLRTKGKARGTTYFAGAARASKKKTKATRKKATRKKATRKAGRRKTTSRPVLAEVNVPRAEPVTV